MLGNRLIFSTAHRLDVLESCVNEQSRPLRAVEQWRFRTEVEVSGPPPAFEQAERNVAQRQIARNQLHEHQKSARCEALSEMRERLPQVGCCMQDVAGDDEVEIPVGDALRVWGSFDVEELIVDERGLDESLLCRCQEQRA